MHHGCRRGEFPRFYRKRTPLLNQSQGRPGPGNWPSFVPFSFGGARAPRLAILIIRKRSKARVPPPRDDRSEEHTSELQRITNVLTRSRRVVDRRLRHIPPGARYSVENRSSRLRNRIPS